MDVASAGVGSSSAAEPVLRLPPIVSAASSPVASPVLPRDDVSDSLRRLASAEIGELLLRFEHARGAHDPQMLEGLVRTAVAAVNGHNLPGALAVITEMARLHPEHAAHLVRATDSFAPIRGEINHLFERLTFAAKTEAAATLAAASSAILPQDVLATNILATGQLFLESGTLINYARAAELGRALLENRLAKAKPRGGIPFQRLIGTMWRRVPMLVLLVGWCLLGLALPEEIQATGFLVLVGFQFVQTTWRIYRRDNGYSLHRHIQRSPAVPSPGAESS